MQLWRLAVRSSTKVDIRCLKVKRISISERPNYAHVVQNKLCCKVLNKPEIDGYLQYGGHHI